MSQIDERNHTHVNKYYRYARSEILELIPEEANSVLDIGCGAGRLGVTLKSRRDVSVHGVQVVHEVASEAAKVLDRVWSSPVEEAIAEMPDNAYDCIVLADVLEHLEDPWSTLDKLRSKLSQGGCFIASIPNVQNWTVLRGVLEGRFDYMTEGILDRTHLRFFTRKSIRELFWNSGLRIEKLSVTRRGMSPSEGFLSAMKREGISNKALKEDGETFQYIVVAGPLPARCSFPQVKIIILNWNGKKDTLECLASVMSMDYKNYDVIVVDNGSTDGSVDAIRECYPDVKIIENGKNIGYAAGNNAGIYRALEDKVDYVFILNNDVIVDPNLLTKLVDVSELDGEIGIVGPANYYYDKPDILWSMGASLSRKGDVDNKIIGQGELGLLWNHIQEVDSIVGSAILVKKEVFSKVGVFDERYFLCHEEYDFSARVAGSGYKSISVPSAKIWHKVGASLGEAESPLRNYFNVRNRLLWAKQHMPFKERLVLQKKILRTLREVLVPPLYIDRNADKKVRRIIWGFHTWFRGITRNLSDPLNKSTLVALRDYYIGKGGDCPESIRKSSV